MELYAFLRNFADSWHLLFMALFFISAAVWVFRPGSKQVHREASELIFRNDDTPGAAAARPGKEA